MVMTTAMATTMVMETSRAMATVITVPPTRATHTTVSNTTADREAGHHLGDQRHDGTIQSDDALSIQHHQTLFERRHGLIKIILAMCG